MKTMLLKPVVYLQQLKWRSEEGATAVEYGLLIALIAAVIIGTVVVLGGRINGAFQSVNDRL
ncbi:MAG: Flp family type IVb pilin [Actinomycetes bacterium]